MRDAFWICVNGGERRLTTEADAAIIKGMLLRGDTIQDVTAYFGTNPGRVAETKKPGLRHSRSRPQRYPWVEPAPAHLLPPPGPVRSDAQVVGVAAEFRREQQRMNEKLDHVLRQLAAFGRNRGLIENPQAPRLTRRKPLEG